MNKRKKAGLLGLLVLMMVGVPMRVCADTYEYDEMSRVTKAIYEDGSYVTYEYDANGNITNVESYDSTGQLVTKDKEQEQEKPAEPVNPEEPIEPEAPTEPEEPAEPEEPTGLEAFLQKVVTTLKKAIQKIIDFIWRR